MTFAACVFLCEETFKVQTRKEQNSYMFKSAEKKTSTNIFTETKPYHSIFAGPSRFLSRQSLVGLSVLTEASKVMQ